MERSHQSTSTGSPLSTSSAVNTRILIASGTDPLLRMVMRFLASHREIAVVGIARTVAELERRTSLLQPDVALVDADLIDDDQWLAVAGKPDGQWTGEIVALVDYVDEQREEPFTHTVTKSRLTAELTATIDAAARCRRSRTCAA